MKEYFITIETPKSVPKAKAEGFMQEAHAKLNKMSLEKLKMSVYGSRMAWTLAMHQLLYREQYDSMESEQLAISNAWTGLKAHLRDEVDPFKELKGEIRP